MARPKSITAPAFKEWSSAPANRIMKSAYVPEIPPSSVSEAVVAVFVPVFDAFASSSRDRGLVKWN